MYLTEPMLFMNRNTGSVLTVAKELAK